MEVEEDDIYLDDSSVINSPTYCKSDRKQAF